MTTIYKAGDQLFSNPYDAAFAYRSDPLIRCVTAMDDTGIGTRIIDGGLPTDTLKRSDHEKNECIRARWDWLDQKKEDVLTIHWVDGDSIDYLIGE